MANAKLTRRYTGAVKDPHVIERLDLLISQQPSENSCVGSLIERAVRLDAPDDLTKMVARIETKLDAVLARNVPVLPAETAAPSTCFARMGMRAATWWKVVRDWPASKTGTLVALACATGAACLAAYAFGLH